MAPMRTSRQALTVEGGRQDFLLEVERELLDDPDGTLTADIYARDDHRHPQKHLGYWVFELAGSEGPLTLALDLHVDDRNLALEAKDASGGPLPLRDSWVNPEYPLHPQQDLDLVLRGAGREETLRMLIYVRDTSLLSDYYSREEHQETAYSTANLVLDEFHRHRLRVFRRLFRRYIPPGSEVLDVGSGYSLIRCCRTDWPFRVTCCDLDEAAMRKMSEEAPDYRWVVGDAADLPFGDGEFDAVFAGEIIEHLPDPREGLREWLRVLRPGGVLIMSTPNLRRLMNVLNKSMDPVNPEHISEMTYRDIVAMLEEEGLEVVHREGIYLEWLFNYFRRGPWIDLLPFRCNRPACRPLVRASMYAGRLFRPWAQNLVFVALKPRKEGPRR